MQKQTKTKGVRKSIFVSGETHGIIKEKATSEHRTMAAQLEHDYKLDEVTTSTALGKRTKCKVQEDVCIEHDEPLVCEHRCDSGVKHCMHVVQK